MLKLAVLSISFLLLGFHAIGGILPEIRDSLGITQTQSEILVTAPSIAILIFVILSNFLIEKIGMKKTVVAGFLLSGIGGVMPVFGPQYYGYVLASRFIFGAGLGLVYTSSVTYINLLFDEKERATLVGFRSAVEMVGQTFLTLGIGFLAAFGWHLSFIVHGVSFLVALLVMVKVPEVKLEEKSSAVAGSAEQFNLIVVPIALFLGLVAMAGSMVVVRFPAMAAEIRGDGFNSSFIVAMKPVLGIIAAMSFGKLVKLLGKKLLYLGLMSLIGSNLLLGFANGNFGVLIAGFLLSSFVLGWVVPIVVDYVSRITSGKNQRLAMTLILICVNIGLFIMPFVVQGIENLVNRYDLAAPYPLMAAVVTLVLGIVMVASQNKSLIKTKTSNVQEASHE